MLNLAVFQFKFTCSKSQEFIRNHDDVTSPATRGATRRLESLTQAAVLR